MEGEVRKDVSRWQEEDANWLGPARAHQDNRGNTFPNGETVKHPAKGTLGMGCSADEADHMGVVVEAVPASEEDPDPKDPSQRRETFDAYNKKKTQGCPALEACFPAAFVVQFAFLSHTHLGFVMKL